LKASQARLARANLSDLASRNGGRTQYLVVDVRDAAGVQKAIDSVFAAEGRVDLVVNTAGINRSRSLRDKSLADFRAVRDLKVEGYQNLKRAFAGRPPRVWCNFSSLDRLRGSAR
jgi:NADP-dependent 3-hydroxy acid dehydrogenase YdfG